MIDMLGEVPGLWSLKKSWDHRRKLPEPLSVPSSDRVIVIDSGSERKIGRSQEKIRGSFNTFEILTGRASATPRTITIRIQDSASLSKLHEALQS